MADLKTLTIRDIPQALELSGAEGWNQTEKDWKFLTENPDNVCLAMEEKGKIVGTATAAIYENRMAWIGMVLVEKSYRGRGYSKLLLNEILNRLKAVKTIKLDATPAGQPVYEKLGFVKEYSISRMVCDSFNSEIVRSKRIAKIATSDLQAVFQFDKKVFGADRRNLIYALASHFPELTGILINERIIKGLAIGRKGNKYIQIGPVSAYSELVAKELITNILSDLTKQAVILDVADSKTGLTDWLLQLGFRQQRQFWRMYLNNNFFQGEPAKQFAICGPEFG